MKSFAIIFFVLALCILRQKTVEVETPGDTVLADRWDQMLAISKGKHQSPWRMQMSLRFGDEGDTRRVTGIMWGNNDRKLRLDVMAGGRGNRGQNSGRRPAFPDLCHPDQQGLFPSGRKQAAFQGVGVPVPFDLPQLAGVLNAATTRPFSARPTTRRPYA